ncbi:MAG: RsmE family RNA methyltransferase, partial [Gammaproteobacteria bacterium]
VRMILSLDAWLAAEASDAQRWVLLPGTHTALRELPCPQQPVELLVGPEGGFTDNETEAMRRRGYQPVRLGPRVLRTETAAPALLAALQALWGDF